MRRLVVEASLESMRGLLEDSQEWFEKIKSFQILTFLKDTPNETALICKVELYDIRNESILAVERNDISIQILEREKGSFICFVKRKRKAGVPRNHFVTGGYLSTPYEIRGGNIRATFLGTPRQVRTFLRTIQKTGIRFKIVSLA